MLFKTNIYSFVNYLSQPYHLLLSKQARNDVATIYSVYFTITVFALYDRTFFPYNINCLLNIYCIINSLSKVAT